MTAQQMPPADTQLAEKPAHIAGKVRGKIPRRLKAKHLSRGVRELIVRLFARYESHDDVAQHLHITGLTGRTVAEVLDAERILAHPARSQGMPVMARRSAA
jgi:hypothetical protein